ncbi:hypothetical protein QBC39DRAFT_46960 [Podospora conica]|nr:hypothetical protein QBC39DRAFT_46960 [Schizothecium conicum]
MVSSLGLSCPTGGAFYICHNNATEFIGCCSSDPCADGSGHCPKNDLRSSSFSGDKYADIPAQECAGDNATARWYTCMSTLPPFLGCCSGNPCATGACLANELGAARLSPDSAARAAFLALDTPTPAPSGFVLPIGAIVGIAIGGLMFVLALVAVIVYKCGWHARKRKERESFIAPILAGAGAGAGMRESASSQNTHYAPSPEAASFGYTVQSPTSPSFGQFQAGAAPPGVVLFTPYDTYPDDGQMSPYHQGGGNTGYPNLAELDTAERRVSELPGSDSDSGLAVPSRPLLSGTTPPLRSPSGPSPFDSPPIPERRDNGSRRVSVQSYHRPPS